MSRLQATFERLAQEKKSAFVAYLCAGDPSLEATPEAVAGLIEGGADIIELGLPFSDPLADGQTNQAAAERALAAGASTQKIIHDLLPKLRAAHPQTPLVLFTYLNPVYTYGYARFVQEAEQAGADGLLLLDLPPDEASHNPELAQESGLEQIRLVAPTSPPARRRSLAAQAQGFLYYVAREGVTGEQSELATDLEEQLADLREAAAETPICVGFGISNPEQAAAVGALADGVVVGSAIVRQMAEHGQQEGLRERLREFVRPLAAAAHGGG